MPVDEAGRFYDSYGWLHGLSTVEAADQIVGWLGEHGFLVEAGLYEHRYPHCWRCDTPLIWRVTDDWLIAVDELRPQLLEANQEVEWTPAYMGKRMDDWLRNMGDWNISRRRYYGLPLPFYPCECGHLNVIGSKAELRGAGDSAGSTSSRSCAARGSTRCRSPASSAARRCAAIPEVGDVWLDAGIVPFSTLGWENPEYVPQGYATGAAEGPDDRGSARSRVLGAVVPGRLGLGDARADPALVLLAALHVGRRSTGRAPYRQVLGYEKMLDESGREMHKSWGNAIEAGDAFERMGADVMRWQYCAQPPNQNLLFGFGPGREIQRKLLTLWNSVKFFVDYANIEGFRPEWDDLPKRSELRPLDRWLIDRTHALVREATAGYESFLTVDVIRAYEEFVDDLSNWYIRRSRRRFWDGDRVALHVLWFALVQSLRVVAPVMPFLTEHLWQILVRDVGGDPPASVHPRRLAGRARARRDSCSRRSPRSAASSGSATRLRAASRLKLRQPLRRLVVEGAPLAEAHADELREELRVKEVEFGPVEATELHVKPHLPVLGPKLGKELGAVRAALAAGEFEQLEGGGFRVLGHDLGADEVLVERSGKEGWAVASEEGVTVALDTTLDAELELEGRVYDLIHTLNSMRKEQGLELTDRIAVTLPQADADLVERHAEWIKAEVLAVSLETDGVAEPQIAKVSHQGRRRIDR